MNRVTSIRHSSGYVTEFSYDAAGNRTSYLSTAPGTITSESISLASGGSPNIAISNPGGPGASYEWFRDGVQISTTSVPSLALAASSPQHAGRYRVIVRETNGAVAVVDLMVKLTGLTYETWLKHKESPTATPADPGLARTANPASDGIENLLKYALGSGPHEPAHAALPEVVWTGTGAEKRFAIRFRRILDPADISFRVEAGGLLHDWRDVTEEIATFDDPVVSPDGLTEEVTLQSPVSLDDPQSIHWRFLRVRVAGAQGTTVLFGDDFDDNLVDPDLWLTSGFSVSESEQIMKVTASRTDQWGVLDSKPIALASNGRITIDRRVRLSVNPHSFGGGTQFYAGNFRMKFGDLPRVAIRYYDMDYHAPPSYIAKEGFYICRNDSTPMNPNYAGYDPGDASERIEPVWGEWFKETIIYAPDTGNLEYFIDDALKATFNVGVMPQSQSTTLTLNFDPGGWWTGHEHFMDDLTIRQDTSN